MTLSDVFGKMRVAKACWRDYFLTAMGLADRTYMRDDESPSSGWSGWSVTVAILAINIVVFFAEYSDGRRSHLLFQEYGSLSLEGIMRGFVWQLLTYQFMHANMTHLVLNSVGLFFFGRPLEYMLGRKTFLKLYLWSGVAGGVFQLCLAYLSPKFGGPMVGASAGISGLVAAFALLNPSATIYLFFFVPLRAKYFLPLIIALSAVLIYFDRGSGIAHGAHLGGTLFGVVYLRWLNITDFFGGLWQRLLGSRRSKPIVKVRFPSGGSWENDIGARPDEPVSGDFISKEIDPILEKISAHGIHSLTERERKILEAARARMEKR